MGAKIHKVRQGALGCRASSFSNKMCSRSMVFDIFLPKFGCMLQVVASVTYAFVQSARRTFMQFAHAQCITHISSLDFLD